MKKNLFNNILPVLILVLVSQLSFGQQSKVITGKIQDESTKEALIGATILIKGSTNGTTTDVEGNFTLKTFAAFPVTLVVSYVGYSTKEFSVESTEPFILYLSPSSSNLSEVTVTARRRNEEVQDIPIPITVLSSSQIDNSGSFNVNRVKELAPSVQLYSSNPRNTTLNIRGLGSTFGLTNDGIDPGVGFYVDGVYYARPAATTIDFIDIEQIEILRGPQGTLFGKNTTAGTFNVTTRRPSFVPQTLFEVSYGNYNFVQAKASVTGPIVKDKLAFRLSVSGTNREGNVYNTATDEYVNTLNNLGIKGQLLYRPGKKITVLISGDNTRQRPNGYAQVYAGEVTTQRAAYRQFDSIIKSLGYTLPSTNPFDRKIDHDTPWRSNQDMGGASANVEIELGPGKLTSTSAFRYWNWDPSNDRDFTGLEGLKLSQAPSRHEQWSQEIRYAGDFTKRLSGVIGVFAFSQQLKSDDVHTEEAGKDQWRFSQNSTSSLWATPGLLDGYGIKTKQDFKNVSAAIFSQADIKITKTLSIQPGIRFNYDQKSVEFDRKTYGGLQTTDPALIALKRSVYTDQNFSADIENSNLSGNFTVNYAPFKTLRIFATYTLGFKPVGLNLGGLPTSNGQVMTELASVKPEEVRHYELGIKSQPVKNSILNLTIFNTEISNYQTLVQTPDLAVNRGYLSNAEKVQVFGAELDLSYRIKDFFSVNGALSYTDGKYVKFTNAPVPLEETGGATFKDISGGALPGISKWSASLGAEGAVNGVFLGRTGKYFLGVDGFYRSEFSSSPSPSKYLNVEGYQILNARLGFRTDDGLAVFVWSRNILDANYFEQLLPGAGNAGHYAAVLGDPRTYGITIRYNIR